MKAIKITFSAMLIIMSQIASAQSGSSHYSSYGVIAIKAIQEQEKIIEKQKSDIQELKIKVAELKSEITQLIKSNRVKSEANASDKVLYKSGYLAQNAPNPFNVTTTISYYIPELKRNAAIEVISWNGQLAKTYPISQKGNGQIVIKAGEFTRGTYYYVLKVDDASADSREMMIMKNGLW